jgi:hypothetical protein
LNQKTSRFEYQVTEFLHGILTLAGVENAPTYRRDTIVNAAEEISNILQSAEYLDADTVTRQLCGVLGLIDDADTIIAKRKAEELDRFSSDGESPDGKNENDMEDNNG